MTQGENLALCGDLQHDPEGKGEPHVCRLPAGHGGYHDPMYDAPHCLDHVVLYSIDFWCRLSHGHMGPHWGRDNGGKINEEWANA